MYGYPKKSVLYVRNEKQSYICPSPSIFFPSFFADPENDPICDSKSHNINQTVCFVICCTHTFNIVQGSYGRLWCFCS